MSASRSFSLWGSLVGAVVHLVMLMSESVATGYQHKGAYWGLLAPRFLHCCLVLLRDPDRAQTHREAECWRMPAQRPRCYLEQSTNSPWFLYVRQSVAGFAPTQAAHCCQQPEGHYTAARRARSAPAEDGRGGQCAHPGQPHGGGWLPLLQ